MRKANKYLECENQIKESQKAMKGLTTELLVKQTLRQRSDAGGLLGRALGNHTCWGVKDSGLGRERNGTGMQSCQSGLTGSSSEFSQIEERGLGPCVLPRTSHWIWLPLEGR